LKEKAFSTFIDQNPPFEVRPEMGFRRRQKPVQPMAHHRQQHHQATSERQIAVARMGHKSQPHACRRTDLPVMAERESGDPERGKTAFPTRNPWSATSV
jgi:hypothetical protein